MPPVQAAGAGPSALAPALLNAAAWPPSTRAPRPLGQVLGTRHSGRLVRLPHGSGTRTLRAAGRRRTASGTASHSANSRAHSTGDQSHSHEASGSA